MAVVSGSAPGRPNASLPLQMLAGFLLGLMIVGLAWPDVGKTPQPIDAASIQAIQMIVISLIFSAVTFGVWRMGEHKPVALAVRHPLVRGLAADPCEGTGADWLSQQRGFAGAAARLHRATGRRT